MRGALLVVVCASGCGGAAATRDAPGSNDGSLADATNDGSRSDATTDARVCVGGADADNDGICDTDDLCPQDYDPVQLDLDGDGRGWSCDDNESLLVDGDTSVDPLLDLVDSPDIFEGVFHLGCAGATCQNRVLVASPTMAYVALGSDAPWLDVPYVGSPARTADDELVFTRDLGTGYDIGRLDPVSGLFSPWAVHPPGIFHADAYLGDRTVLFELEAGAQRGAYEPQAGAEPRLVATADAFHGPSSLVRPEVLDDGTPVIFVVSKTGADYSLHRFTPGQPTLDDVLVGGAPIGPLAGYVAEGRTRNTLYWQATRATTLQRELLILTHDAAAAYPFAGSLGPLVDIPTGRVHQLRTSSPSLATVTLDSVAQSTQVIVDQPASGFIYRGTNPVALEALYNSAAAVWAMQQDGSVTELAQDLPVNSTQVAAKDGAVAILYRVSDATGNHRYFKRVSSTGMLEQGVFAADAPTLAATEFIIAHDGSLLATEQAGLFAVPAGSTTAVLLSPSQAMHCSRLVSATICSSPFTSQAMSAYYGGALHPIAATGDLREMTYENPVFDTDFVRYYSLDGWHFGKVLVAGDGTVSVSSLYTAPDTSTSGQPELWGRDPLGRFVVQAADWLLVDDTSALPVAPSGAAVVQQRADLPIVGLAGQDSIGPYLLSLVHPDRCWTVPGGTALYWTPQVTAPKDLIDVDEIEDVTYVSWQVEGSQTRFSILRPRSHPDRPPPPP